MSNQTSDNNKRIAKNTLFLYIRTLLVMVISIFTSRIVLDILGIEDYGIYNVVGGFVSMFSVLGGTLTAASQRFLSFELGKETPQIRKVFSTTVCIHIVIALLIFIVLESVGLWFLNNKMNITEQRIVAANWVFQCSVLTFCINLISIPYNAAIIAYEKMSAFAYISIIEVTAKLALVYALYITLMDTLILYAIFMLLVAMALRLIYGWYCTSKLKECRFSLSFDKSTFHEILGFSSWNLIGSTAGILNNQGINVLMNIFFGVTLNAARGIAQQVDNAINSFVQNFLMALNPQITKSYASGDFQYINKIIIHGTKLAFFLFWLLCFPVYINAEFILDIWLKRVPENAALFVRLALVFTLCQTLSQCLYTTMLATGKIKKYQIIVGGLSIMAFPTAWIFFKLGLPGEFGYWAMIIFSLICLVARLFLLKEMLPNFSPLVFVKKVIVPITGAILLPILSTFAYHSTAKVVSAKSFFIETILSLVISLVSIWTISISKKERASIITVVKRNIKYRL